MKYNAMLDIAFTVVTEHEDWQDIPAEVILKGLRNRLEYLEKHPEEIGDAIGFSDQFEEE